MPKEDARPAERGGPDRPRGHDKPRGHDECAGAQRGSQRGGVFARWGGSKPRTRRVAAAFSEPSAAGHWLRGIHFSAFSLVMMGVLVLAVVILAPTLQTLLEQRQQIADQQKAVDDLSAQVDELKSQRARWDDPSYIRAQARDRLYYVMPGEVSYLVIDDRPPAARTAQEPISSSVQKTQTDWVGSLFTSFIGAGLTDAPATPAPAPSPSPAGETPAPDSTGGKQ